MRALRCVPAIGVSGTLVYAFLSTLASLLALALASSLVLALVSPLAHAEMRRSVEQDLVQLRSGKPIERAIPDASVRVAVFTFEDPDGTGLGDALAALVGREVLLRTRVSSIGVIRYEGRLGGSTLDPLSYFEKVDMLTSAQEVTLALWGAIRKDGDGLVVDTFAQLPARTLREKFEWTLRLPQRLGGDALLAQLRPDRLLVQRTKIASAGAESIRDAARRLDELRREPRDASPLVPAPPRNAVYWFERIEGQWARVAYSGGRGWVRFAGHCTGPCAPLLDGAAFVADLLRYSERGTVPAYRPTLAPDAIAAATQIAALAAINESPARAKDILAPLQSRIRRGQALSGGAAIANLNALADVAIELTRQDGPYDGRTLDPAVARAIAFELAEASQLDPRNADVLTNLVVLFRLAGDATRAGLARELTQKAGSN